MIKTRVDRRSFVKQGIQASAAAALVPLTSAETKGQASQDIANEGRRIRVGVIGCGSVSGAYLPQLAECPYADVVSTCDIIFERAQRQSARFDVPHQYPHIEQMLAGEPFDLFVNLTDMQEHEHLNRQAIAAGKHVWSEKPIANSLDAGQEILALAGARGVHVWGAPIVVASPQFAFMAKTLAAGRLGRIAAAHADYGHTGPDWSSFFYEKGGGSMPDLGVYNLTTLTGLLGPARVVTAMTSIVTTKRNIRGKGEIDVTEEDNAMVVLDHGDGVLSHVQSGFNYFNPHGHDGSQELRHTIRIVGTEGAMGLVGYDWEPLGVDLATSQDPKYARHVTDAGDYVWQRGANMAAEFLVTGRQLLVTAEHALHVVEIMVAARQSQRTGRHVELHSTFKWPVLS